MEAQLSTLASAKCDELLDTLGSCLPGFNEQLEQLTPEQLEVLFSSLGSFIGSTIDQTVVLLASRKSSTDTIVPE